jgi:hypothetical protein
MLIMGLILGLLPTACTNDGDIGDLYGQWQLTAVETSDSVLYAPSNCFLSFQSQTVQSRIVYPEAHVAANVTGNYQHVGDSLLMQFYLVNDDYENLTADTLMVRYYRFPTPRDMRFHILNLDNKKLILARGDALWSFRKY